MILRKPVFPVASFFVFLACLLIAARTAFAQASAQASGHIRLTLSQVVELLTERNDERGAALAAYRGLRSYEINYRGVPRNMHAEMVVELTYSAPSTEEFKVISQSGSKFLIDRVLKRLLDLERGVPRRQKSRWRPDHRYELQFHHAGFARYRRWLPLRSGRRTESAKQVPVPEPHLGG